MKIDTVRVQSKRYKDAIRPGLQKKSQEYRVLATLKYFYPERYGGFILADKPDLQNKDISFGVEVTIASSKATMKASREFSKLKDSDDTQLTIRKIETTGHTVSENIIARSLISPLGTIQFEKHILEQTITRKIEKIETYSGDFSTIGLAIILMDPPTSEAEKSFPDWISYYVKNAERKYFDFYYILCHRFLIICDEYGNMIAKRILTSKQSKYLLTIGRMSAEGEIKFSDIEWQ